MVNEQDLEIFELTYPEAKKVYDSLPLGDTVESEVSLGLLPNDGLLSVRIPAGEALAHFRAFFAAVINGEPLDPDDEMKTRFWHRSQAGHVVESVLIVDGGAGA